MHWMALTLGGFYLLGGLVALRQARMNLVLDRALARISLEATPRDDRIAGAAMLTGAVLTILSGGVLLLHSRWAVVAFGLCWSAQAVYLLWAVRTEDYGRPATIKAFGLYTLATLAVVWLAMDGALR